MANKPAAGVSTQNEAAPAFSASTERAVKVKTQKLQRMLASRMQSVEKFGKMTPKMQRGFDRFAANIANAKEK